MYLIIREDSFLNYELDNQARDNLVRVLNRQGITSWTNKTDIQSGTEFQEEINKGIEGTDNLVYLLSPNSVSCTYCERELAHALKYKANYPDFNRIS